jgi:steroid 5-alpha reductase family enzyme
MLWWGVFASCAPALGSASRDPASGMVAYAVLWSLVSPAFITFLLTQLSGIPLLEAKHRKEYAGNQEYAEYVRTTGQLLPRLSSFFASKSTGTSGSNRKVNKQQ